MRQYLTSTQAARLLRLSEAMVRLLAQNGRLPTPAMAGNRRLFDLDDVQALVERRALRTASHRQPEVAAVP